MNSHELWQVEVEGRVYEACIEEVIEWIQEGSVLPTDKARRGSLRWLPAERVPELRSHFSQTLNVTRETVDADLASKSFSNEGPGSHEVTTNEVPGFVNSTPVAPGAVASGKAEKLCSRHPDVQAAYICGTCADRICEVCTHRFGSVRLCPMCGAMCIPVADAKNLDRIHGALNKPYARKSSSTRERSSFFDTDLSLRSIGNAMMWPLRRKIELAIGCAVFAVLTVSLAGGVTGETSTILASTVAALLVIFIGSAVHQHLMQSTSEADPLLPRRGCSFIRSELTKTMRTAVGSVIVSFGLFTFLTAAAGGYAWYEFSETLEMVESHVVEAQLRSAKPFDLGRANAEKEGFQRQLEQRRETLVNSVLGRSRSSENPTVVKVVRSVMRLSVLFLLPMGVTFIFGLVVFPAACVNSALAGSFKQSIDPLRVIGVIRRSGFDYITLLALLSFASVAMILLSVLVYFGALVFENELAAIVAAVAVAGGLAFYFLVIFSRLFSGMRAVDADQTTDRFHAVEQVQ